MEKSIVAQLATAYWALAAAKMAAGALSGGGAGTAGLGDYASKIHGYGNVPVTGNYQSGGIVKANLHEGEFVVNRTGVSVLDNLNKGIIKSSPTNFTINLKNESGVPLEAEQKDVSFDFENAVISVILKSHKNYGPMFHLLNRRR